MSTSLMARMLALAFLTLLSLETVYAKDWLSLVGFALIVNTWPFISVGGTVLAASLAPVDEGTSMGLFNATFALASTVGALATGWVAFHFGYERLPLIAFFIAMPPLAMIVSLWRWQSSETQQNPPE